MTAPTRRVPHDQRSLIALILGIFSCVFSFTTPSHAQQGPIDPNWVYTTPLEWHRGGGAPRDVKTRWAGGTTAIFYPEHQYVEITANLYRDGQQPVQIPGNDGLLIRTGTWTRTDDRVLRIESREVYEDKLIARCKPDVAGRCIPEPRPIPGPIQTEMCGMEGSSKTHLAAALHCKRLILIPATLPLDLKSIGARAQEGFQATPKASKAPLR